MTAAVVGRLNAALEGRYAIERELGEGGMATVYLAADLEYGRKVALKPETRESIPDFPGQRQRSRVGAGRVGGILDGGALWHAELGDGSVRERRMLFEGNWATHCPGQAPVSTWDVHPDGASFVFVRNPGAGIGDAGPCTRNVPVEGVVNWFEELRERLGN